MAISIAEQYPGKTDAATTEYPLGKARNVTAPGDGTGTPWEQAIVNDDQGFKQALLGQAGITPSGTPDTATVSQYLEAVKTIINQLTPIKPVAWVRFGYVGGSVQVFASAGVSSVTRLSQGKYRVTFSSTLGGTDYAVTGSAQHPTLTHANILVPMVYTATYVDVWVSDNNEDINLDTQNANVVVIK